MAGLNTLSKDLKNGGYEILLHNVSHSDLVLSLNGKESKVSSNSLAHNDVIARPKFSNFKRISEQINFHLNNNEVAIVKAPTMRRKRNNGHDMIQIEDDTVYDNDGSIELNAGFDFRGCNNEFVVPDQSQLRFRKDDGDKIKNQTCLMDSIYFPLVSLLIPEWIASIPNDPNNKHKVLMLITGAGTPADSLSNFIDNSTEFTGKIIKEFVNRVYPGIEVIHIHSLLNIFRYDENIEFVKVYLNPHIENLRDKAARLYGSDWKQHFHMTLSFADGSSARTSAISAAIRLYK